MTNNTFGTIFSQIASRMAAALFKKEVASMREAEPYRHAQAIVTTSTLGAAPDAVDRYKAPHAYRGTPQKMRRRKGTTRHPALIKGNRPLFKGHRP
ncbi:hypothetical protein [uncultured Roseobacter sp.]|uniref:hypothetical protein n=1 Tax=uncultured Roseobacter sp. TaxID=114847 RepID=UPI002617C594|nr:hypothetical protein [uncultured Roseobacter sp.]